MKAVVLAAGYATRLYPLTKNQAKPLLTVGKKTIVEHIIDKLSHVDSISEIFIVTNDRFYNNFQSWLDSYSQDKKIKIVNDGTFSNDDRLGAIGDLNFVVQDNNIKEDILMIAGDNLFGFSIRKFVEFFNKKGKSVLAFCDLKEEEKVANKFGVGILDENHRVKFFEEKPSQPKSTFAATCCYIYNNSDLNLIPEYIKVSHKNDNPGDFAKWLIDRSELHGFVFDEHWFDIGSFEGLEGANKFYEQLGE
jgi:glucose-1-phosphate thymidylyltransferase